MGERVFGLLRERKEFHEGKRLTLVKAPEVRIENLYFRYEDNKPSVLEDFSLTLHSGKATAIVGASGSGKSTVAALLLRFYEPDQGRILVDGEDIKQYSLQSIRGSFALVKQDSFLFNSTIKDNICLWEKFDN